MQNNWIKVTDRLPTKEESKRELIIFDGDAQTGFYDYESKKFTWPHGPFVVYEHVTHWQNLPEPPEQEETK